MDMIISHVVGIVLAIVLLIPFLIFVTPVLIIMALFSDTPFYEALKGYYRSLIEWYKNWFI